MNLDYQLSIKWSIYAIEQSILACFVACIFGALLADSTVSGYILSCRLLLTNSTVSADVGSLLLPHSTVSADVSGSANWLRPRDISDSLLSMSISWHWVAVVACSSLPISSTTCHVSPSNLLSTTSDISLSNSATTGVSGNRLLVLIAGSGGGRRTVAVSGCRVSSSSGISSARCVSSSSVCLS